MLRRLAWLKVTMGLYTLGVQGQTESPEPSSHRAGFLPNIGSQWAFCTLDFFKVRAYRACNLHLHQFHNQNQTACSLRTADLQWLSQCMTTQYYRYRSYRVYSTIHTDKWSTCSARIWIGYQLQRDTSVHLREMSIA